MNATRTVERLRVTGGDRQSVSHAGIHLLGELADRVGVTSGYSAAIAWSGERAFGHDRGRVLGQVAVMLAAGGRCVADMAALRDQPDVFGDVASGATIWRTFDVIDGTVLDGLRAARVGHPTGDLTAVNVQRGEQHGRPVALVLELAARRPTRTGLPAAWSST